MPKPRTMSQLLSHLPSTGLQQTLEHGMSLYRLERGILAMLPDDLASHCRVANLKSNVLTLAVPSSAWANRLRFQQTQLLQQLRGHKRFHHLRTIRVVIIPERHQRARPSRPMRLSNESADIITSASASVGDEALSHALKQLARHANKGRND